MEEDQSQSQPQPSRGQGQPAMGLQDYQFTFECSAPSSTNGSFLEPDVRYTLTILDSTSVQQSRWQ